MRVLKIKDRVTTIEYTELGEATVNGTVKLNGVYDYNDVMKLAVNNSVTEVSYKQNGKLFKINVDSGIAVEVN